MTSVAKFERRLVANITTKNKNYPLHVLTAFKELGNDHKVGNQSHIFDTAMAIYQAAKESNTIYEIPNILEELGCTDVPTLQYQMEETLSNGILGELEAKDATLVKSRTDTQIKADIRTNDKGIAYLDRQNIEQALKYLRVSIRYNEFTLKVNVISPQCDTYGADLSDSWVNFLFWRLQEPDLAFRLSKEHVWSALDVIAKDNGYHPVKTYLEHLPAWDGKPRVDRWVIDGTDGGAEDDEYTRAVCGLPLLAAVKRVMVEPGAQFDELLIIHSAQGLWKSTAIRTLVPDATWFDDNLVIGTDPKSTLEATMGKWIMEAGEVIKTRSVDHTVVKQFFSRKSDRARLAYARLPSEHLRQWVPIGTTNVVELCSDDTGDRRYWPVSISKKFNIDWIKENRDQIWAEAVHRIKNGESIRLDASLYETSNQKRKNFSVENPVEDILSVALCQVEYGRIPSSELWDLVGTPERSRKGNTSLKVAMAALGWKATVKELEKKSVRCFEKEGPEGQSPWWRARKSGEGYEIYRPDAKGDTYDEGQPATTNGGK